MSRPGQQPAGSESKVGQTRNQRNLPVTPGSRWTHRSGKGPCFPLTPCILTKGPPEIRGHQTARPGVSFKTAARVYKRDRSHGIPQSKTELCHRGLWTQLCSPCLAVAKSPAFFTRGAGALSGPGPCPAHWVAVSRGHHLAEKPPPRPRTLLHPCAPCSHEAPSCLLGHRPKLRENK